MDFLEERKKRAAEITATLRKLFPEIKIAPNYSNNWELMVAVQLSVQCTDKKVNEVTKTLFKKYPEFADYLKADIKEFEQDIKQTGLYHNKAKNILATAHIIQERFGGELPRNMKGMLELPGVARKVANVVLGNAYGVVEGIAVDTHVRRLSQKLGLTGSKDPVKIEKDLMELLPKEEWFDFTSLLIEYGREYCIARKHKCINHPLSRIYPKATEIWP